MTSQAFRVTASNLKEGDGLTGDYLAVTISSQLEDTSPEVCVTVQEEPEPAQDLRLEAQNLLIAIAEHDQFIGPVGAEVINLAIHVLDKAREKEEAALTLANTFRNQDRLRALAMGDDPEAIPSLDQYVNLRGMVR
jgi:hypothetical protein